MKSLTEVADDLAAEVATRTSPDFGIKVGRELFDHLVKQGKITKETFSVSGSGAFPMELPAYDGKHYVLDDWELGERDFRVGVPAAK